MITTDRLPEYGILRAYLTATAVTWEEDVDGPATEEHGYVDARWSLRELYESRNDVRPYAEWDPRKGEGFADGCCVDTEDVTDAAGWIRYTLAEQFGTTGFEDNGDGTFYGADQQTTDHTDPRDYTYALHFHVKHNDPTRGWVEDPVTLP